MLDLWSSRRCFVVETGSAIWILRFDVTFVAVVI
jgi:hypothetical protein